MRYMHSYLNRYKQSELKYPYSVLQYCLNTIFKVLLLETPGTRKILVLVRLCTRYLFEKAIEYTSILPNGKASCRSALKCQSNFVLPRVMSKYVTTSVRSSFIVQVLAFNFLRCRTSANCYWSHTLPDVRSRGAIPQHFKAQYLALLDFETVA